MNRALYLGLALLPAVAFAAPAPAGTRQVTDARAHAAPASARQVPPTLPLRHAPDPRDANARRLELTLPHPAPVTFTCDEVGGTLERHRLRRDAAPRHRVTLRGLKASTRYRCAAEDRTGARSPAVSFVTAPLPVDLKPPRITVPSADVAKTGYTLYDRCLLMNRAWTMAGKYLVILDAEGNVRWYLEDVGGGIDATWLGDDLVLYGGADNAYHAPTVVGLDKQVRFTGNGEVTSPYEAAGSWNHDAGITRDGGSIFAVTLEFLDGWNGFAIRHLDLETNEVLWSWSSVEDGYLAGYLPPGSESATDPYHANSVWEQWEDGRLYLYVSLFGQYQVIKIDYDTKEVVWKLGYGGDFTLLEPDGSPAVDDRWFVVQHDAKLYGDRLSLYDNGLHAMLGGTDFSRALQLELDQDALTARIAFEYTEPEWLEWCCGGYDPLPDGNSLIALAHSWPFAPYPDKVSALIEVDASAKVVWRADFPSKRDFIYRADRIDGCAVFHNTRYCPELE